MPPGRAVDGELIMNARENTTVLISFPYLINDVVFLEANVTTYYTFEGGLLRCAQGVEEKGLVVVASNPIAAHLGNANSGNIANPDITILRPMPGNLDDVFLVGYANGSTNTEATKSFYMVVAYESGTEVQIFMKQGNSHVLTHEFALNRNEVFTENAFHDLSEATYWIDYTGGFVRSSKPVAVYSGHGSALVPETVCRSLFVECATPMSICMISIYLSM